MTLATAGYWVVDPAESLSGQWEIRQPDGLLLCATGTGDFGHANAQRILATYAECERLRAQLAEKTAECERLAIYVRGADLEYDALQKRLAAAQEDTKRLDWLEGCHAQLVPCQMDVDVWDGWNVWDGITQRDLGDGDTLRAALDAARGGDNG